VDEVEGRHIVSSETARYEAMSERELGKEIKRLEKEMVDSAKNLEFEKAAHSRDELFRLRQRVFGADQHGSS
jgi:excinuclease ABC subunit B